MDIDFTRAFCHPPHTMVNIADAVISDGLAGEDEVRETIAGLAALTEYAAMTVAGPRIFQVRGLKRATSQKRPSRRADPGRSPPAVG